LFGSLPCAKQAQTRTKHPFGSLSCAKPAETRTEPRRAGAGALVWQKTSKMPHLRQEIGWTAGKRCAGVAKNQQNATPATGKLAGTAEMVRWCGKKLAKCHTYDRKLAGRKENGALVWQKTSRTPHLRQETGWTAGKRCTGVAKTRKMPHLRQENWQERRKWCAGVAKNQQNATPATGKLAGTAEMVHWCGKKPAERHTCDRGGSNELR